MRSEIRWVSDDPDYPAAEKEVTILTISAGRENIYSSGPGGSGRGRGLERWQSPDEEREVTEDAARFLQTLF